MAMAEAARGAMASVPEVWDVGARVGAAIGAQKRLRSGAGRHTGSKVRGHWRRGHWHRYWTGHKADGQALVPRWVAPMWVGDRADGDPATVREARP